MDGWMDGREFRSFPKIFQSYPDAGRVIMKGHVQCNPMSR